jgi:RNA polymerase I-specific transcription initiation factor RRN7
VEIYAAANRLRRLVGFTYSFPATPRKKLNWLALPEAQMIALIIVATKLFFPFDDLKRYPASSQEPAAQLIDWKIWALAQRNFEDRVFTEGRIGQGNELLLSDKDVFNMTAEQLDEYMDWYENNWLDSRGNQM